MKNTQELIKVLESIENIEEVKFNNETKQFELMPNQALDYDTLFGPLDKYAQEIEEPNEYDILEIIDAIGVKGNWFKFEGADHFNTHVEKIFLSLI
ncbi:MAG: hypothetical protein ACTJGH_00490 [Peptoniphilaceae bacterium]